MTTSVALRRVPSSRAVTIAATVAAAVAVNLVIWLVGLAAGGSFEVTDNGRTESVAPGGVIIMSAIPAAIGLSAAALLALRWARIIRVAQLVGPTLAIATIAGTITTDFDTASTVALSTMHVALAVIVFGGLEALRHR